MIGCRLISPPVCFFLYFMSLSTPHHDFPHSLGVVRGSQLHRFAFDEIERSLLATCALDFFDLFQAGEAVGTSNFQAL